MSLLNNARISLLNSDFRKGGLWILLSIGIVSCNFNFQPNPILIEKIAQKKSGKIIYVTGKVAAIAPFVRDSGYKLQDDTGSIWVMTSSNLPVLGTEITIKGKVQQQNMMIAEQNHDELYLIELQKLAPDFEL